MDINKLHAVVYAQTLKGGLKSKYRKLQWAFARVIYSFDIPSKIDLSEVYLCHNGFGIVINPGSVIGKGTIIQHSVTIGEKDGSHRCPIIGDNCFIGARAIILGAIRVGNNVKIGAGAVVINDVPDNCTVVGVPAKVIKTDL